MTKEQEQALRPRLVSLLLLGLAVVLSIGSQAGWAQAPKTEFSVHGQLRDVPPEESMEINPQNQCKRFRKNSDTGMWCAQENSLIDRSDIIRNSRIEVDMFPKNFPKQACISSQMYPDKDLWCVRLTSIGNEPLTQQNTFEFAPGPDICGPGTINIPGRYYKLAEFPADDDTRKMIVDLLAFAVHRTADDLERDCTDPAPK